MKSVAILNAETRSNEQMQGVWFYSALHLLPGVITGLVFIAIAAFTVPLNWPPSLALLVTWLVAGLPFQLGFLLYQGRKLNGRISLDGIVQFRESLPRRQYLWLVPLLFLWAAVSSTVLTLLSEPLRQQFFAWWPSWLLLTSLAGNLSHYSPTLVWAVVLLSFPLNLAVPIVEEMYFRGYLLPRLTNLKQWAPLVNVLLFSLYHFWLPWENPMRIVVLLPIVYAVWWKRNIYLSISVHCLLNLIGSFGLLALVLSQPQAPI